MKNKEVITAEELAAVICRSLEGLVPEEDVECFGSENFETGAVYFNLRIRYPSMTALFPARQ